MKTHSWCHTIIGTPVRLAITLLLAGAGIRAAAAEPVPLLDVTSSVWRYHTNKFNPGYIPADAWVAPGFNDTSWPSGRGTFGFESTADIYPAFNTYITPPNAGGGVSSYFRTHFTWTNSTVAGVTLMATNYVDDGMIVWLNGVEISAFNMPANRPVAWNDSTLPGGALAEPAVFQMSVPATGLLQGDNVLAVQLQQSTTTSSDNVWGMSLWGQTPLPPVLTSDLQPKNRTGLANRPLILTASFSGSPILAVQWYFQPGIEDGGTFTPIPGATNANYLISNMALTNVGLYYAVISNSAGSTNTRTAVVQISEKVTSQTIAQQAYLKASNTGTDDAFGNATAISGNTLVVGAPSETSNATGVNGNQSNNSAAGSGAAYVFVRSGTNWVQQAYLKASNTGVSDIFGSVVAISGDTIVIGAPYESSSATGVNGDQSNGSPGSGAAYVFVRTGTNWSQQAYLKASNTHENNVFGMAVAVSGDTVVVGAEFESSGSAGVNGDGSNLSAPGAGAAYVFVRTGTRWAQQAYLKASNPDGGLIVGGNPYGDWFGGSVAVSGDLIVVGAPYEDSNATGVDGDQSDNSAVASGAAYVFARTGNTWSQQAYLKASNTAASGLFGGAVSISGDTIVVGAPGEQTAYVFAHTGNTWSQQARVKASNTGGAYSFGGAVSISGDTVVVGAYLEASDATGVDGDESDNSAYGSGAAYVFLRSGTSWTQQAYLKASNTEAGDSFGFGDAGAWAGAVSISGDTVVVGAVGEASNATGVNGNQASNSSPGSGAAYVFTGLGKVTPRLAIAHSGATVQLSWLTNAPGFVLQAATTLANGGDWQDSLLSATETNGQKVVPLTPTGARGFFRLRGP